MEWFILLAMAGAVSAAEIALERTRYTTFVSASSPDPRLVDRYPEAESVSSFKVSRNPLDDTAYAAVYPPYVFAEAEASADTFSTYARAQVGVDSRASAYAKTELTFTVGEDLIQPIELVFNRSNPRYYSDTYVSLVDVATNDEYWRFGWTGLFAENAFFGDGPLFTTSRSIDAAFRKDQLYRLTIYSGVETSEERKWIGVTVAGLQVAAPVPEPETWAMAVVGIAAVGAMARRRRGTERTLSSAA